MARRPPDYKDPRRFKRLKVKKPFQHEAQFKKGNSYAFKPGQSGNPNGTPKGERISTIVQRLLDKRTLELVKIMESTDSTAREKGAAAWVIQYANGEDKARAQILDRTEGGIKQVVVTLPGDAAQLSDEELDALWQNRQTAPPPPTT